MRHQQKKQNVLAVLEKDQSPVAIGQMPLEISSAEFHLFGLAFWVDYRRSAVMHSRQNGSNGFPATYPHLPADICFICIDKQFSIKSPNPHEGFSTDKQRAPRCSKYPSPIFNLNEQRGNA